MAVENGKMSELGKMDKAAEHQKSCQSAKEVFFKAVYCVAEAITLQKFTFKAEAKPPGKQNKDRT